MPDVLGLLLRNGGGAAAVIAIVQMLLQLAILILVLAGMWKAFVKAGKPGWAAIIPIYNIIVLLEIVGKPIWWVILCFIPCVNIVIILLLCIEVAKCFGKDAVFGILLFLFGFICWPILGFGSAQYVGPGGGGGGGGEAAPPAAPPATE
jgi:hypothetical protein